MKKAIEQTQGAGLRGSATGATVRLLVVTLISLGLGLLLWHDDLFATSGLFQSPATSTPEPPTATATIAAPTLTLTLAPTLVPTATATTVPAVPTVTVALTPTIEATPEVTSTAATATAPPLPATVATIEPSATAEPSPTASGQGEAQSEAQERYPEEAADLRFNWGELFDSLALGLSYGWLCCGLLLLVSVPVLFLALGVAGRRRATGSDE